MRKIVFAPGEFYHVYNRGVDKRTIFENKQDIDRFFESMVLFNERNPIGSIFEKKHAKAEEVEEMTQEKLVHIISYCLNPNHFHLLLEEIVENGISNFMKRLGGGYTNYFNERHKRSGSLFQGTFKATHVESNEYLLHVSAYINLNYKVHKLKKAQSGFPAWMSSWEEYLGYNKKKENGICEKGMILGQFKNSAEYKQFAEEAVAGVVERRYAEDVPQLDHLLME